MLAILLFCVIFGCILQTDASCRPNFGGCDRWNGRCWDTGNGRHYCTCKTGYSIDKNNRCHAINECKDNPCGPNSQCVDTPGSYICRCDCGYVLDYTKSKCLNIRQIEGRCHRPSWCYSTSNGPTKFGEGIGRPGFFTIEHASFYDLNMQRVSNPSCKCEIGYKHDECGLCVDIDECKARRHNCDPNSECFNTEGSFTCRCYAGYFTGPCGKKCYRNELSVPASCDAGVASELLKQDEAGSINTQAVFQRSFGTFVQPIVLNHFDRCDPATTNIGDLIDEEYDIDNNGIIDVRITWSCSFLFGPRSLVKNYAEREAYWGPWTCWTACKATCWGGIQTRSRRCWYGSPGTKGCLGNGSEKKTCFSGTKCTFRVRKDITSLTREEKEDLMQAMEKYKADMSTTGFHNAASSHGWPYQCNGASCCPHSAKMHFMTWHRAITYYYEAGLTRYLKSKTLGMPYWNWLAIQDIPDLGWAKTLYGKPNPFTNATVLIDREGPMRTIQRDDTVFTVPLNAALTDYRDVVQSLMKSATMHEFAENLENVHGGPHVATCTGGEPRCLISLAQLTFAGFDPLFMFHHSMVDKLSAVFQKKIVDDGSYTWTPQTVLESFEPYSDFSEPHQPFDNETLNPFPEVAASANMRDFFHYEELMGYKYDCIEDTGFGCNAVGRRVLRLPGAEQLFIAQYLRNLPVNVYVNYFVNFINATCKDLTDDMHLGRMLILGSPKQRPYKNTIPTLIPVQGGGGELSSAIPITACLTANNTCRVNCTSHPNLVIKYILPTPALVYQYANTPVDVFKFNWSPGSKLPTWPINIKAGSQWLYFFGDRTANIRQVPTGWQLNTCNTRNSRSVPCSQTNRKACILPPGIYYLVDSSPLFCRRGLRMYIRVTR